MMILNIKNQMMEVEVLTLYGSLIARCLSDCTATLCTLVERLSALTENPGRNFIIVLRLNGCPAFPKALRAITMSSSVP